MRAPPAAKRAAAPIAPVLIGIAAPFLVVDEAPPAADDWAAPAPPARVAVGVGTPEVYGTSVAVEAPEKAADWVDAVGLGIAIVMLGFRTLRSGLVFTTSRISDERLTCQ